MSSKKIISREQIEKRQYWVEEIAKISGRFGDDSEKVEQELSDEIKKMGIDSLLGHLRLCGAIPENYGHDSTEEKLYSKYTDIVLHEAFKFVGLKSAVLRIRADVADIECVDDKYCFVADAKAFRMSRTAKNQKDFKIQAMDGWKHGKDYAMVVCPIYQLPSRESQIYQQAAARSVCILSYTHLAVLVRYAVIFRGKAVDLILQIFKTVEAMNPSKSANDYWQAVNKIIIDFDDKIRALWMEEKLAAVESIDVSKKEALEYLARERERIMRLSKEDAIREILKTTKLENKIRAIEAVNYNGLLDL